MITHFNKQILPYTGELPLPGLSDFLNQFGSVWYGVLTKEAFNSRFNSRLLNFIGTLADIIDVVENQKYKIDQTRFNLNFLHKFSSITQWYWPAIVREENDWLSGNSRLFTTGLTQIDPWKHLQVLALSQTKCPDFLENPVQITSDALLWKALDFDSWANAGLRAQVSIDVKDKIVEMAVKEVDLYNNKKSTGPDQFDRYLQWFKKYSIKPRIGIYTDWPDLIYDSHKFWDIVILDRSPWFNKERPASIELAARRTIMPDGIDHVLYVGAPTPINLSLFLVWMDLEHNQFSDVDWKFCMVSRSDVSKNKFIRISDTIG